MSSITDFASSFENVMRRPGPLLLANRWSKGRVPRGRIATPGATCPLRWKLQMLRAVKRQARLTFDDRHERVVKPDGSASTRRVMELKLTEAS